MHVQKKLHLFLSQHVGNINHNYLHIDIHRILLMSDDHTDSWTSLRLYRTSTFIIYTCYSSECIILYNMIMLSLIQRLPQHHPLLSSLEWNTSQHQEDRQINREEIQQNIHNFIWSRKTNLIRSNGVCLILLYTIGVMETDPKFMLLLAMINF